MKYQLVIQFPEDLFKSVDEIASMEDQLDGSLVDAEVDGHDIGSGEINIFIHTNSPENTFETVKNILEEKFFNFNYLKIAYRKIGDEEYIALWPDDLEQFNVS